MGSRSPLLAMEDVESWGLVTRAADSPPGTRP